MTEQLALSINDLAQKDVQLLGMPISSLTKIAGLKVRDVYDKLLPALASQKDLYEGLQFAEVGLKYAAAVDQNRLREEIGVEFVAAIDLIIGLVQEGLNSDKGHIKRKSMMLHKDLIDEHAEKRRFVETIMVEDKLQEVAKSNEAQKKLQEEIIDI